MEDFIMERALTKFEPEKRLIIKDMLNLTHDEEMALGLINVSEWYSKQNFNEACREIDHFVSNLKNGWEKQTRMNFTEILDIWSFDKMERNSHLLATIGVNPKPKIYRASDDLSNSFTLPMNDGLLMRIAPIEITGRRVPVKFSKKVNRLDELGGGYDRYHVAEPVETSGLWVTPTYDYDDILDHDFDFDHMTDDELRDYIENDPWLLGSCGNYITIIGEWDERDEE
jgi:hypothetical protein